MSSDGNVIDITDVVENLKTTFIKIESEAAFQGLTSIPALAALRAPILNFITRFAIKWVVSFLANRFAMLAFFTNTAIRKSSQAKDYVDAVTALNNLPSSVSDEEYEKHEQAEISAFNNFVMVTN